MRRYGQVRVLLADRIAGAVARAARVGRLAVQLATTSSLRPADVYAAIAVSRFMAAHELIERAERQAMAAGDDETELVQIRQPIWFGGTTIVEDEK